MLIYQNLKSILTPKERRLALLVLSMMFLNATIAAIGIASIMPFLAVVGNPAIIHTNPILSWTYQLSGAPPTRNFLLILGFLAFVVIILGSVFKALTEYATAKFVHMRRHTISCKLLHKYVNQPYVFFLNRNSADLSKSVLSEVEEVILSVLKPGMELATYSLVTCLLIGLLFFVDLWVSLILVSFIGGAYAIIYIIVRGKLNRIGIDRIKANKQRFTAAGETFGGIKDIKLLGRENAYLKRFAPPSKRFASHQANNQILRLIPKYGVEAASFGAILLVTIHFLGSEVDLSRVLPVLGIYAFTAFRLMPALQRVYQSLTILRFGLPALEALANDLTIKEKDHHREISDPPMQLNHSLVLENITYTYPNASSPILSKINLTIPAKTTIGIVGTTGAGKTTLLDIILGLLPLDNGRILIDGHTITNKNKRSWQRSLGYVPQHIYLSDETVTSNIAFGIPKEKIDFDAVKRAAKTAALQEFILNELTEGYDSVVGERGIRLSGGQRQRIGIARAMYNNPSVLIMDEATSALDSATEKNVIKSIDKLKGKRTIIMVAHRLSTVKDCDIIFILEKGELVGQGCFKELAANNHYFQKMIGV